MLKIKLTNIEDVQILHICNLWTFPIKNVIYLALQKFHLHGDFRG